MNITLQTQETALDKIRDALDSGEFWLFVAVDEALVRVVDRLPDEPFDHPRAFLLAMPGIGVMVQAVPKTALPRRDLRKAMRGAGMRFEKMRHDQDVICPHFPGNEYKIIYLANLIENAPEAALTAAN